MALLALSVGARRLALPALPFATALIAITLCGACLTLDPPTMTVVLSQQVAGGAHQDTYYAVRQASHLLPVALILLAASGVAFIVTGLGGGKWVAMASNAGLLSLHAASLVLMGRLYLAADTVPQRYVEYPGWAARLLFLDTASGLLGLLGQVLIGLSLLAAVGLSLQRRRHAL